MRFDQCGLLDSSFGINGLVRYKFDQRNRGDGYKLQTDGKIVCVGLQAPSNAGSQQTPSISRFNTNGSPDSTFNGNGTNTLFWGSAGTGEFYSAAILPDNKILAFGYGGNQVGIMRFLPNGLLDLSFNGDGQALFTPPASPGVIKPTGYLLQNGKLLLTCLAYDSGGSNTHFFSVRLDSTGVVDTTYGTNGYYFDNSFSPNSNSYFGSALDANENLIFAGNPDPNSIDVIRISSAGQLDSIFGVNGHANFPITNTIVKGVEIFPNGNIIIRGSYSSNTGFGAKLLSNGTIDSTFGVNGFRVFDFPLDDLIELPNGKWLTAGSSFNFIFKKYTNQVNVPHISESLGILSTTGTGSYQWLLNGTFIPFANQSIYTPIQNGSYNVILTDVYGCTYVSDSFVVANVGILEVLNNSTRVYPNPVKDELTIESDLQNSADNIIITDALGRLVNYTILNRNNNKQVISVASFNPGVYFLSYEIDDNRKLFKIIKN
jgi:uncharacterized delta-60 repeat protein